MQRIFKAAKDLYVFGFFRYYFFTISNHYAFLAIESAIRHRYNQWLGEKAVLTCETGYLFWLRSYYKQYLNDGDANDKLKNEFKDKKHVLSRKAKVSQIDDKHWEIVDDRTRYRIEDTGTQLNIYKNGNLRHEMFNPSWHRISRFCQQNNDQGWKNYRGL